MAGKKSYRIVIPTDAEGYKKLIEGIDKQNDALGNKSPLKEETDDIKQGVVDMTEAAKLEAKAKKLRDEAESLIQQRNTLMKTTLSNEKGWRTTLEGKYIKNIQSMGDFGYTIDRSARPTKETPKQ